MPVALVVGSEGQLGREVVAGLEDAGWAVSRASHESLELGDLDACRELVASVRPEVVIDCAQPRSAVGEPSEIVLAARNAATAAWHGRARSIYVSCADVFDGEADRPYYEWDDPSPATEFGRAKLTAEREVAASNPDQAIVRSSWLFGEGGENIVDAVLASAELSDRVAVDPSTRSCPTYAVHLAGALVRLAGTRAGGIFHVVGAGACSRLQLARRVLQLAGSTALAIPLVDGRRPDDDVQNLVLGSSRADAIALPRWQTGVSDYLESRGLRAAKA
jgi:dTDP-4-dehydrorhamnose reductase